MIRVAAFLLAVSVAGFAQYRMPPIPAEKLTPEQKKALDLVQRPPRPPVGTTGPFIPLLRSPELMNRLQETGAYLRFQSSLPQKLVNMIALLTARYYTQQYEWDGNYPMSIKNGLSPAIADAIGDGRRPTNMDADEEMLYNFVMELQQNKSISDASYERMVARFGEKGAVEAAATAGYYSTLAGIMNMARSPRQPESRAPRLAPLPH